MQDKSSMKQSNRAVPRFCPALSPLSFDFRLVILRSSIPFNRMHLNGRSRDSITCICALFLRPPPGTEKRIYPHYCYLMDHNNDEEIDCLLLATPEIQKRLRSLFSRVASQALTDFVLQIILLRSVECYYQINN